MRKITNEKIDYNEQNFFSKTEKDFGNSIRYNKMIVDISKKICTVYMERIQRLIDSASTNHPILTIGFSLSRMGVIFVREGDSQMIDTSYNDYGYAAVESITKRKGIAWILQDNLVEYMAGIPEVSHISVSAKTPYSDSFWINVSFYLSFQLKQFNEL